MRENEATTKPWFSRLLRHLARKMEWVYSGIQYTLKYLLTYLLSPDPHWENNSAVLRPQSCGKTSKQYTVSSSTWRQLLAASDHWIVYRPLIWSQSNACVTGTKSGFAACRFSLTREQRRSPKPISNCWMAGSNLNMQRWNDTTTNNDQISTLFRHSTHWSPLFLLFFPRVWPASSDVCLPHRSLKVNNYVAKVNSISPTLKAIVFAFLSCILCAYLSLSINY